MRLDLSSAAQADLDEVLAYSVDRWGLSRGFAYVEDIRKGADRLAARTSTGTRADDLGPGLRRYLVGRHVIVFQADGEALRVLRILHQRQDAARHLR